MRRSRGMGIAKGGKKKAPQDANPNSVDPKIILRKDNPNKVRMYAKGGKIKK